MNKGEYSFQIFPDYSGYLVAMAIDSIPIEKFVDFWERVWRVVEPIEKLFGGGPGEPNRTLVTCGYGDKSCGLRILVSGDTVRSVTGINDKGDAENIAALNAYLKKNDRKIADIVDYCEKKMAVDGEDKFERTETEVFLRGFGKGYAKAIEDVRAGVAKLD